MKFFPFKTLRLGQDTLIKDISDAVISQKSILVHAPTGLGKTAACLSGVLEYSLSHGKTVFFLTPKHTQHTTVIDTLKKIKEKTGQNIKSADIIGKKWMCHFPNIDFLTNSEFSEYCRDLRNEEKCRYYSKVFKKSVLTQDAIAKISELHLKGPLHVNEIISNCTDFCSYEISMALAKNSDLIVMDYYHMFHPKVRDMILTRLSKKLADCILIVDEAHNLSSRIRDILTMKLSSYILRKALEEARDFNEFDTSERISNIQAVLQDLTSEKDFKERFITKDEFNSKIGENINELTEKLLKLGEQVRKEKKRSFVSSMANFLEFWNENDLDENAFARILKKSSNSSWVSYNCLDPSIVSKEVFDEAHASILMSGTLTPQEMYRDILGINPEKSMLKVYQSSFPRKNRLVLIVPDATTRYSQRDDKQFEKIAGYCANIITSCKSNMALFFPSYAVRDVVMDKVPDLKRTMLLEEKGMNKRTRDEMVNKFKESEGGILCGVVGGSFSEGLDYPGKNLECVVIIGIPLSTPDLETKSLIDYYEKKFKQGWNYGYIYPAINKTIQAAGRCIRSEYDRGVVVLIDERYLWHNYLKCLPPEWVMKVTKTPGREVKEFLSDNPAQ